METDTSFVVLNSQQMEICPTASRNPEGRVDIDPISEETNENDKVVKINDEVTGVVIQ